MNTNPLRHFSRRGRLTIGVLLSVPAFFCGYALREPARAARNEGNGQIK